ncbi:unnamed protein product [marine sediment metagenome]|uniref:Phage ABA sandwich domain-containing protein n=1 Tax=marine sediment metagenome TaxID=412755 RepID=X1RHG0_9ZZZZ
MNKVEILVMEAGEELDRLVATEVMGEPVPEFTPENALDLQLAGSPVKSPKGNWLCLCRYGEGDIPTWRPLPYSTDISAAWLVVEKLAEGWERDHEPISIEVMYDCGAYEAKIETWNDGKIDWNEPILSGSYNKAPEAICKAALLTRLDEIKELEE